MIKLNILSFIDSEIDPPSSVYHLINVRDVNTGISALIDKREFASLPPCNPMMIPREVSGAKSKRKRTPDNVDLRINKPISMIEKLNMITDKVITLLHLKDFLF